MRQVGGHAIGQQILVKKGTQFIVGHAAGIKGFSTQLRQRHRRVCGRATTGAAAVQALHTGQQVGTALGVNQRHVALFHAQGLQLRLRHFVFGVHQGVANGVEVVMGHGFPEKGLDYCSTKARSTTKSPGLVVLPSE